MASLGPWQGGGRRPSGGGGGLDFPFFGMPNSSDVWDPLGNGNQLGFRSGGDQSRDDVSTLAHAHVDWRETDNEHIFRVDLPGLRKEDLKVCVEDENVLQISGERIKEEEQVNDKWHRVERSRGHFMRRFRLPENANLEEIKCELVNGVLTVFVPKKEIQETPRNVRYIDVA